jgi:pimeloyl-ACP methyl ester carboxylesterase
MATFVLVHGAWHGAWCWFKVVPLLQEGGHRVIAIDLPSHGIDRTLTRDVSLRAYAERVCEVLDTCEDPVILAGHSMGGLVISSAAEMRPSKIAKLVYVAAFLLRDGQILLDAAQADTRSQVLPNVVFNEGRSAATLRDESIRSVFYADCKDDDVALARALLVPQAAAPLATPLRATAENWGRIPRIYIECVRDNAISIAMQRAMYAESPCQRVISMNTSHSPFFSAPDELADHLLRLAP